MPCPHGRRRDRCKECGGGSLCPHGRRRYRCKECGGSSICTHGRRRSHCKECGRSGLCPHGRRRSTCKECGGGGLCAHGRRRDRCKECGGKGICAHGRRRSECKECGGGNLCTHGRRRSRCKECGQGRKRKAGEALCRPAHCPPAKSGPICQAAESLPKEASNDRPELARRDEPMRQPSEQMEQELRIAEPRTRRQAMADQRLPRAPRGHLTAGTNNEASSFTAWPVGCMVWTKLPQYRQAWPGRVADPVVAGVPVLSGRPRVLVMYYGESSYDWFKPEQLKTFEQGLDQGMRDAQASKHLKLALQLAMEAVGADTEPLAESGSVSEPSAEPNCVAVAHESGPAVGAPASPTMGGKRARPEMVEPDSFEVERIVARWERRQAGTEYLVKWQGYPEADNTWEPAAHLPAHLVAAFDKSQSPALTAKRAGGCAYERRRAARIEQNQQVLSGLGLQPDQRRAKGLPGGSSRPRRKRAKAEDESYSQSSNEDTSAEEEETDEGETEELRAGRWRPFGEALEYIHSLGLPGTKEWREWSKSDARPADIPGRPDQVYAGQGWQSWGRWLGTDNVAKHNGEYRPFGEALEYGQPAGGEHSGEMGPEAPRQLRPGPGRRHTEQPLQALHWKTGQPLCAGQPAGGEHSGEMGPEAPRQLRPGPGRRHTEQPLQALHWKTGQPLCAGQPAGGEHSGKMGPEAPRQLRPGPGRRHTEQPLQALHWKTGQPLCAGQPAGGEHSGKMGPEAPRQLRPGPGRRHTEQPLQALHWKTGQPLCAGQPAGGEHSGKMGPEEAYDERSRARCTSEHHLHTCLRRRRARAGDEASQLAAAQDNTNPVNRDQPAASRQISQILAVRGSGSQADCCLVDWAPSWVPTRLLKLPSGLGLQARPPNNWPRAVRYTDVLVLAPELCQPHGGLIHGVSIQFLPSGHPACNGPTARGLFAVSRFGSGQLIGQYTGLIKPKQTVDRSLYLLSLSDQLDIDSQWFGNELRFVNDYTGVCTRPNARFETAIDRRTRMPSVQLRAITLISPGSEIVAEYAW